MQVIREIVTRDVFKNFDIPKEFGDEFEMILIPTKEVAYPAREISVQGSADTWNEQKENEHFLAASYNAVIKDSEKEDEIWSKYL